MKEWMFFHSEMSVMTPNTKSIINQSHHVVSFFHEWTSSHDYEGFEKHYLLGKKLIEKAEEEKMRFVWDRKKVAYDDIKEF